MNKSLKIIICGGGTGGHIYSAIAIADKLKEKLLYLNIYPNILFLGSLGRMEMEKIPLANYHIYGLKINKIPNILWKKLFVFPIQMINSFFTINNFMKKFNPNIVIGTGEFISLLPLIIAVYQKKPTLIQEQNLLPGSINKILSKYVDKICLTYEESLSYFKNKNKIIITGNPLRSEILNNFFSKKEACKKLGLKPDKPVILSIGGSQGAHSINNGWLKNIKILIDNNIQIIWQVGNNDFNKIKQKCIIHPNILIYKYIENINLAYAASDVVVSRAGGLAISELSTLGKPCLLIPFPWAKKDHQTINAQLLVNNNAALMIKDNEIETNMIKKTLKILNDVSIKNSLSKNILKFSKPNATEKIVDEILKLIL
ncbi:MAG: undecaprenyldiphospho-muramoylpentapeptide beta-N-acetylglucosaminyltransferase [Candidatus Bostrichicola ureolyticus]|nr:MAG: undecaprenyldiphospho-muramoylpentapeptide beta-N-acetylglucosaminyltransferase [Candidatus Bostrichicola ureolyticus]